MRDEHVGQILLLLEVQQQVDDLRLDRHVQCGDRLVADDESRLGRQRTGNADTLPLAAGELVREPVQEVGREAAVVHDLEDHLLHTGVLLLDHVVRLHTLADDLADAHARVQRGIRVLEDELHVAAQTAHLVVLQSCKVDAVVAVCLIFLEFGIVGIRLAQRLDLLADCRKLLAQGGDLIVAALQALFRLLELAFFRGLAGLLGRLFGVLGVVHIDHQALALFFQRRHLAGNVVVRTRLRACPVLPHAL